MNPGLASPRVNKRVDECASDHLKFAVFVTLTMERARSHHAIARKRQEVWRDQQIHKPLAIQGVAAVKPYFSARA